MHSHKYTFFPAISYQSQALFSDKETARYLENFSAFPYLAVLVFPLGLVVPAVPCFRVGPKFLPIRTRRARREVQEVPEIRDVPPVQVGTTGILRRSSAVLAHRCRALQVVREVPDFQVSTSSMDLISVPTLNRTALRCWSYLVKTMELKQKSNQSVWSSNQWILNWYCN